MRHNLALSCLLAASSLSSWTTAFSTTPLSRPTTQAKRPMQSAAAASDGVVGQESIITPEGFGFSAPARRILKEADRGNGFYKANSAELVIDVMEAITTGQQDVALVYGDDNEIKGLFTETDYIKVRSLDRDIVSKSPSDCLCVFVCVRVGYCSTELEWLWFDQPICVVHDNDESFRFMLNSEIFICPSSISLYISFHI